MEITKVAETNWHTFTFDRQKLIEIDAWCKINLPSECWTCSIMPGTVSFSIQSEEYKNWFILKWY